MKPGLEAAAAELAEEIAEEIREHLDTDDLDCAMAHEDICDTLEDLMLLATDNHDTRDGSDGTPQPNWAMSISNAFEGRVCKTIADIRRTKR
jgi:hypothetical protein